MIDTERARKERINRKARFRERTLEFAKIYLSRGVYANEPEEGPFMMPSWGIFEDDPQVKALLTEDDCKIPFTGDRYEQIEDLISEGVINYNIRARRDLARMHGLFLLHWESEADADENIIKPFLARATTVFHMACRAAPKCISYQTFSEISHLALVHWNPAVGDPPKWSTVVLGVTPDVLAGRITRELLRVAGAPENSTWEQMERICGKRLICTCRRPGFRQPVDITTLVSPFAWASFALAGGIFPTMCPQIQHIRYERTWSLPEAEKWRDDGSEDESFVDAPTLLPPPRELTNFLGAMTK